MSEIKYYKVDGKRGMIEVRASYLTFREDSFLEHVISVNVF